MVGSIEMGLGLSGSIEGIKNEDAGIDKLHILGNSLHNMEANMEAAIDINLNINLVVNTSGSVDNECGLADNESVGEVEIPSNSLRSSFELSSQNLNENGAANTAPAGFSGSVTLGDRERVSLDLKGNDSNDNDSGFGTIEAIDYSQTVQSPENADHAHGSVDGAVLSDATVSIIVKNDPDDAIEGIDQFQPENNNPSDDEIIDQELVERVRPDLPSNGRQLPKLSIDCSILKNATPLEQLSAISSALRSPYGSALFTTSANKNTANNDFIFPVAADLVPNYNYHNDFRDAALARENLKEDPANRYSSGDEKPSSSKGKKRKKSSVDGEREYRCDECGKSFTQQAHLSIHQRKHTGERPYVCPYEHCGKRFTQFGNLRTHERKHTGERPYKCSFPGCGKAFSQMGNMKTHEQLHSGVRPYACNVAGCSKSFTQLGNLKSHQFKVHPEILGDNGDSPPVPGSGIQEMEANPVKTIKRGRKPSLATSRETTNNPSTIVTASRPSRKAKSTALNVSYDDSSSATSFGGNNGNSLKNLEEIPQHMLPPRKRKVSSSVLSSPSFSPGHEPAPRVPLDIQL